MKLFTKITQLPSDYSNVAIALGTFDGVHIGHQKIIGEAVNWAKEHKGTSVVFTFSNHPLSIVSPRTCPKLIYTNKAKASLISSMGVDILFDIPFTPELLQLSPENFVELLYVNLKPLRIIVGPNYSYGFKGKGTPEMLTNIGLQKGFAVLVPQAVKQDGLIVSSTIIRQNLSIGNVKTASQLLGRQYALYDVTVIAGQQRGRELGYPTANISIPDNLIVPSDGVYIVKICNGDTLYTGVANIGTNPTFEGTARHIEVHILNFSKDIYDQTIDILFYDKLRNECRFPDANQLKLQINDDIEQALRYFEQS